MFMFDVETLGIESNSVILSMACIYFDMEKEPTYKELVENAFFVKLNAKDQIDRLGRTVTKSTLTWWNGQHDSLKKQSLIPSSKDVLVEDGIAMMAEWSKQFPGNENCVVWARGNLDQMCLGSMEDKLEQDALFHFGRWRDVRTAVDVLTGSTNGYCKVDHPEFNRDDVIKHNPIHDCAYDAMMLMYGK
jgi:hypothetical protein